MVQSSIKTTGNDESLNNVEIYTKGRSPLFLFWRRLKIAMTNTGSTPHMFKVVHYQCMPFLELKVIYGLV